MLAHVSTKHKPLLDGFGEKMRKTPATIQSVLDGLPGYKHGSSLTIEANGETRTLQIEALDVPIRMQGDKQLTLHVKYGKKPQHRFMIYVHMRDIIKEAPRVEVSMRSDNFRAVFGEDSLMESTQADSRKSALV